MLDTIIVSGFSDYNTQNSYAIESPFLLFKNDIFCDAPGLYKLFVNNDFSYHVSNSEAPPFVCYALKQLLSNRGFQSEMVFYLDLETDRLESVLREQCRAIILTTTLITDKVQLQRAVAVIKKYNPTAPILCGGTFVDRSWIVRNKILREKDPLYAPCKSDHLFLNTSPEDGCGIDLFIISDPDLEVATNLLTNLKKGLTLEKAYAKCNNCARLIGNEWHFSSRIDIQAPILPSIDWQIFRKDEMRLTAPLLNSKGCPNRCQYCSFQKISPYQEKPSDILHREVNSLLKTHFDVTRNIHFCDDNLCGTKESAVHLADFFIGNNIPFKWTSFFDARFLDNALAEKLKASGCILLKIGMESASDTILKNMAKPCRVKHYRQAVTAAVKAGISLGNFFIVGFPGETDTTLRETIDTLNSFPTPTASLNQMTIFPFILAPLSPIFTSRRRAKYDLSGYMQDWSHATMNFKKACESIPRMMQSIYTMQPLHGTQEKILVENPGTLAKIDKIRGDLIRKRLATGGEDPVHWQTLKDLIGTLSTAHNGNGNLVKLV